MFIANGGCQDLAALICSLLLHQDCPLPLCPTPPSVLPRQGVESAEAPKEEDDRAPDFVQKQKRTHEHEDGDQEQRSASKKRTLCLTITDGTQKSRGQGTRDHLG